MSNFANSAFATYIDDPDAERVALTVECNSTRTRTHQVLAEAMLRFPNLPHHWATNKRHSTCVDCRRKDRERKARAQAERRALPHLDPNAGPSRQGRPPKRPAPVDATEIRAPRNLRTNTATSRPAPPAPARPPRPAPAPANVLYLNSQPNPFSTLPPTAPQPTHTPRNTAADAALHQEEDGGNRKFHMKKLPKYKEKTITALELHSHCEENPPKINLDPEYQRGEVWTSDKQSALIQSLMMGSYIPPIIFNKTDPVTHREGQRVEHCVRNCVDGKQRIQSVNRFLRGEIGVKDERGAKWFYCHPIGSVTPSKRRSILPQHAKEDFENVTFKIIQYKALDAATENWIFQSVQGGVALVPAEKTRALGTRRVIFCKEIEEKYKTVFNLCKKKSRARAEAFNLASLVFSCIYSHDDPSGEIMPTLRHAAILQKFMEEEEDSEIEEEIEGKVITVLNKFLELLDADPEIKADGKLSNKSPFSSTPNYFTRTLYKGKSFSPVEFISTVLLLYKNLARASELLLQDVKAMRGYLRQTQRDLRMNTTVFKTAWEFITLEMAERLAGGHSADVDDVDGDEVDDQHNGSDQESGQENDQENDQTGPERNLPGDASIHEARHRSVTTDGFVTADEEVVERDPCEGDAQNELQKYTQEAQTADDGARIKLDPEARIVPPKVKRSKMADNDEKEAGPLTKKVRRRAGNYESRSSGKMPAGTKFRLSYYTHDFKPVFEIDDSD